MNQHRQALWPSNLIVKQTMEWENGPENRAVLLVPRFRKGFLSKWLQPRLKRSHMRVKLDEVGSFAWQSFDGKNTIEQVASLMREKFGQKIEPAEERLQRFLTVLKSSNFVEMYERCTNPAQTK